MNKIISLLVISLLLISTKLNAQCMMAPVSITERANIANVIIEGKVLSKYSRWDINHRIIETVNTIEVYTIYKGNFLSKTIDLITEGGVVGTEMLVVNPSLDLIVGEYGVFDLKINNEGTGYKPVASTQSFIKFDYNTNTAKGVFDSYNSLSDLRLSIVNVSNQKEIILKKYKEVAANNTFKATPIISNFSPTTASAGTYTLLTINGSNFGASAGSVMFANANDGGATFITATGTLIQSWSNTQITVYVPKGASTGAVKVVNSLSQAGTSAGTLTITYNISGYKHSDSLDYTNDLVSNNGVGGYNFTFNTAYYSNTEAVNRYEDVINQWRCETGVNWKSNGATTTSTACEGSDGINVVTFDNTCGLGAGVLGTCYSFFGACSSGGKLYWRISEIDVKFDAGTNWNFTTAPPTGAQYDFYSVMLHEMGHGHQLGHVGVSSDVMYYSISNGTMKRTFTSNNSTAGNYVMTRNNVNELAYTGNTGGSTVANACSTGPMVYDGCTVPPTANFSANQTGACASSLSVNFTDESTSSPTAWNWNFGDGTTSTLQNPSHNYVTTGAFDVRLIASNAFGADTLLKVGYISVAGPAPTVVCIPTTTNTGDFGTGIDRVQFHTIDNSHTANNNDGTQNFTCSKVAFVNAGVSYPLTITGDGGSPEYCRVYIDYNNDGTFTAGEIVYNQMTTKQTSHSTSITIPASPVLTGQNLRMRIMTDFNLFSTGCANMTYGEVEDYGVFINNPPCTPPAISSHPSNRTICVTTNTTFVVAATNAVSYQWQVNTGSGFNNISNGGVYSGATTVTLSITGATSGMNGYTYKCVVTGSCAPTATSNIASLTVNPNATINLTSAVGSDSQTLCVNNAITNITYSIGGGGTGGNVSGLPTGVNGSFSGGVFTISGTPTVSGTFNYTVNTTGTCIQTSAIGSIIINASPSISSHPSNSVVTEGNNTSFSVTASNTTGYQWQVNTGAGFNNVSNGGVYSNATTATLNITGATLSMNGNLYRCVVNGTCTPNTTSNSALLTVNAAPVIPTTSLKSVYAKTYTAYNQKLACYQVANAQDYEWEFTPVGGGTVFNYVRGFNNPSILLGWVSGILDGTQYNVRIRAKVGGVFGSYGQIEQITTPGASGETVLVSTYCGKTYTSYAELLNCYTVVSATEYEFEFDPIGGGTIVNHVHNRNSILLSWVNGLLDNTTYKVRIRVKVGGTFGSYGNICQITTPSSSNTTSLKTSYCGVTYTSMADKLACYAVVDAEDYEWEFVPVGGGSTLLDTAISTSPSILLNFIPGIQTGTSYDVRIRPRLSGVYGSFGASCQITTPSGSMMAYETSRMSFDDEDSSIEQPKTTLNIYPNPNSGEQLNVSMENLSLNSILTITDIYGKVILTKQLNTDESDYKINVKFDNKLSAGFYLISISSSGNTITEKLIVR